jgi:hypothetical protein
VLSKGKEFVQMKCKLVFGTLVVVVVLIVVMVAPAVALPDGPTSMNARMMHFQEVSAVIHIMVFDDDGRNGVPALVDARQPLLFGFEWGGYADIADLQAALQDPENYFTVSVDGGSAVDIMEFYQPPFEAETQSGPAWTWDHDGDGPGDGDGDGVGDWIGPVVFFRFPYPGVDSGMHTFEFALRFDDIDSFDSILVEAID